MSRALMTATFLILALTASGAVAEGHPLGNFTVNHYLGVVVRADTVLIDYVIDMAEIPAFQERPAIEADSARACAGLAAGILIRIDDRTVPLVADASRLAFPPGQGGLPTLRLECSYRGTFASPSHRVALAVADTNYEERIGWREIVARGDGVALDTSLPSESVSARLTAYPESLLTSPLDVRSGQARVGVPSRDAFPVQLPALDTAGGSIAALLLALALGALHAVTPGHGKTIMAAYLVGSRRSLGDAAALGLVIAVTHTAGVLLLALVVLAAGSALTPERVYPFLSAVSAAVVVLIGLTMLSRVVRSHLAHRRGHEHVQPTTFEGGWRSLAALGLAGGVVPSASALVLLLGTIAARHPEAGVILVIAFGAGMAVTLVGAGVALIAMTRALDLGRLPRTVRFATPAVSALLVLAIGLGLTAQSLLALL